MTDTLHVVCPHRATTHRVARARPDAGAHAPERRIRAHAGAAA